MKFKNPLVIFDPLEQFDIIYFCKYSPNNLNCFIFFIFISLLTLLRKKEDFYLLKNKSVLLRSLFNFIRGLLNENLHVKKKYHFFLITFIFIYILFCNSIGLIPYSFTITSSFITAFWIASTLFGGINIISIYTNRWKYFSIFLPKGVPTLIIPFLIPIEIISYFSRVVSLSVRLFANMMSGHTLFKILIGFLWLFLVASFNGQIIPWKYVMFSLIFSLIFSFIPWLIIMAVLILECAIAFLQAYVFAVLVAIYLNDGINLH